MIFSTLYLPLTHHKKYFRNLWLIGLLLIHQQCSESTATEIDPNTSTTTGVTAEDTEPQETNLPNILFILADDLGVDAMPGYDLGAKKPSMPTIERLANQGVRFTKAWSNPVCSPTRASILTGKYGHQTRVLGVEQSNDINPNERIIQRAFNDQSNGSYSTSIIGKWHVSAGDNYDLPEAMGVDYYAGLFNGGVNDYSRWRFTVNGSSSIQNSYITSVLTDLAIEWIVAQNQPWFCWLAYTAPHTPFHLPPQALHYQGELPSDEASIAANQLPYYFAMIESLDTEIGRLLDGFTTSQLQNTLIVFMGDNGTPNSVAQPPYTASKAKGTLYEGGVHVPLIVSGYGVLRQGEEEDALVSTVDLYNTLLEAAGLTLEEALDSKSFWPLMTSEEDPIRTINYTEVLSNRANRSGYALTDGRFKWIVFDNGNEQFFDLENDAGETINLLNNTLSETAENALKTLQAKAAQIRQ